ncbi:hypothetical protein AYI69_g8921 [Smittium culicis]|uniref:Uncharacterized protein n=1 Tax=Smittium culicis TaxID=133412 RepID=A0A1R1XGB5_9FUNG|nr:hypothetical protein AYI69_g8921 [Smittium culicis]
MKAFSIYFIFEICGVISFIYGSPLKGGLLGARKAVRSDFRSSFQLSNEEMYIKGKSLRTSAPAKADYGVEIDPRKALVNKRKNKEDEEPDYIDKLIGISKLTLEKTINSFSDFYNYENSRIKEYLQPFDCELFMEEFGMYLYEITPLINAVMNQLDKLERVKTTRIQDLEVGGIGEILESLLAAFDATNSQYDSAKKFYYHYMSNNKGNSCKKDARGIMDSIRLYLISEKIKKYRINAPRI